MILSALGLGCTIIRDYPIVLCFASVIPFMQYLLLSIDYYILYSHIIHT